MIQLTDRHKQIYNLYLKAYRVNNKQPFRAKQKFNDIEKDPVKLKQLDHLRILFEKYPAFCSDIFFNAPYKIYQDENPYHSLKFYTSFKGVSTCIAYIKILQSGTPTEQFDYMKESYKFVARFCIEKNISLDKYTDYCSISQNDCLLHMKQHKICWYLIFSIPKLYDLLKSLPSDEFAIYFGSVDLNGLYQRYISSPETQVYLDGIRKKVTNFVKNACTNTQPVI